MGSLSSRVDAKLQPHSPWFCPGDVVQGPLRRPWPCQARLCSSSSWALGKETPPPWPCRAPGADPHPALPGSALAPLFSPRAVSQPSPGLPTGPPPPRSSACRPEAYRRPLCAHPRSGHPASPAVCAPSCPAESTFGSLVAASSSKSRSSEATGDAMCSLSGWEARRPWTLCAAS